MSRIHHFGRGALILGSVVLAASCTSDHSVVPPLAANSMFQTYVALGNSITAGMQSGGLNDSTQRESYAFQLAGQMHTRFAYPSFPKPGCPPPIGNFVSGKLIDSLSPVPGGCTFRDTRVSTTILNDVAVPLAYTTDLTTTGPALVASNTLQTLILGGISQVDLAVRADPTFATMWIGNNEVLGPATVGQLSGSTLSPPLIPTSVFIPAYAAAANKLKTAPNLKGGVLVGVVQVSNAPRFFPADSLIIPAVKAGFDAATGKPSQLVGCGASGYLMSTEIIKAIKSGALPPVISCIKNVPQAPLGDIFMIDPAELAALSATVDAYNSYIKAKADSIGFAYVDPNPSLVALRAAKAVPNVPAFTSAKSPFGTYFSLDGVHPAIAAHKLIANLLIDAINAKYATTLAHVP